MITKELFSNLPIGLVLVNEKGKIVSINNEAKKIYEVSDDVIGSSIIDFIISFNNSLKKSFIKGFINLALKTGITRKGVISTQLNFPDGRTKYVLFYLSVFKSNGKRYLLQLIVESSNELFNNKLLRLYRKSFNYSPNSQLIADYFHNEPHIIKVNEAFTKLYGYKPYEVVGKNPRVLKSGIQSRDYYKRMWDSLLNPKKGYWHDEIINKTKDGRLINVILTINTLFNKNGKPLLFAAHHVNISDLRKAEIELRVKDSLIKSTLDSTRDGILTIGEDWSVINYNKPFVKLWGLPKRLLRTNDDKKLIKYASKKLINPRLFVKRIKELYLTNIKSKDLLFLKDGRVIERIGEPLIIDGVVKGRVWSFRDITKRLLYEKELRAESEKLKSYLNASGLIVLVTNKSGKILMINDLLLEISGYSRKELLNHKWTKLLVRSDYKKINNDYFNARLLTKNGDLRIISWRIKNLNNELLIIGEDVTERQKREDELKRLREEEQLNKARKEFLLLITHELKQPLTPIMGYADLLKEQLMNVEQLKYLDKIISSAQEMYELVSKIVNLMKIETGQLLFNFSKISLLKLINDSLRRKASIINLKNIHIKKKIKETLFTGDYNLLRDVLVNLIDNAVKFSNNNGLIEIKGWSTKSHVYFSVKDHGVGIKKEDLPKLFKTFSQTIEGRRKGGFGIGLSLCKMIIEKHGGSISVKSTYGKGAEFIVKLPRVIKSENTSR